MSDFVHSFINGKKPTELNVVFPLLNIIMGDDLFRSSEYLGCTAGGVQRSEE